MSGTNHWNAEASPTGGTSWLLVAGPFIALSLRLAEAVGHQGALFLQHLHFWIEYKRQNEQRYLGHNVDGRFWVHWNHDELVKEIPLGRSASAHKRVIKRLKALGVLLVAQHRSSSWDQTCHYSIDYEMLARLLEQGPASSDSKGTNSSDRSADGEPSNHQSSTDPTAPNNSDHSTERSSQSSPKSTPTVRPKVPINAPARESGGGVELDMSSLPTNIRADVLTLLAHRPDAQRYADLLAQRLKRDPLLPEDKRIVNPGMWLQYVLNLPNPDFSEADRFAEERAAEAARRLQVAGQQAKELASQQAQAEERARRHARAAKLLAEYSVDDRAALVAAATSSGLPRGAAELIRGAVSQGALPDQPYALSKVLLAIDRMLQTSTAGTQEQSA